MFLHNLQVTLSLNLNVHIQSSFEREKNGVIYRQVGIML